MKMLSTAFCVKTVILSDSNIKGNVQNRVALTHPHREKKKAITVVNHILVGNLARAKIGGTNIKCMTDVAF